MFAIRYSSTTITFSGVVHENPQIGSDGESEEGSRHSDTAAISSAGQSASATSGGGGGATGTSSSSDLYSSRGGTGSGEGKVSFSGKEERLLSDVKLHSYLVMHILLHILEGNG